MIELQQFLLWIVRKVVAAPKRWFDRLTDIYQYSDWIIPVTLLFIMIGVIGLATGLFFAAVGQSAIGAWCHLTIWFGGLAFIVSAGIRAMYRAFKAEQQEFIETLKNNNG